MVCSIVRREKSRVSTAAAYSPTKKEGCNQRWCQLRAAVSDIRGTLNGITTYPVERHKQHTYKGYIHLFSFIWDKWNILIVSRVPTGKCRNASTSSIDYQQQKAVTQSGVDFVEVSHRSANPLSSSQRVPFTNFANTRSNGTYTRYGLIYDI